jgi:hypothetical protein
MFDGVTTIRAVPGFQLTHGPLLALLTPVDANGKFFANTGEPVTSFLLSLYQPSLDGQGATFQEAEADLFAKMKAAYDTEGHPIREVMRKLDEQEGSVPSSQEGVPAT